MIPSQINVPLVMLYLVYVVSYICWIQYTKISFTDNKQQQNNNNNPIFHSSNIHMSMSQFNLSMTIADAPPPPLQIDAQPMAASLLLSTLYNDPNNNNKASQKE